MNDFLNFVKNNKYNLLITFLYLIITVILMLNHEIWRDEAQVWCIVRDCSFFDVFGIIKIEGHPPFWYLILMPFAKSGLPVITMQIISLIFVFLGVLYIIFKSPFNKFLKTIIVFSPAFIYFLPVIARNYALIPLFIFLLADLYKKRNEKPFLYAFLIVLLSHTHSLIWGFCLILSALFAFERLQLSVKEKKIKLLYPVLIIAVNFLLLFFMYSSTITTNQAISSYSDIHHNKLTIDLALLSFATKFFQPPLNSFYIFDGILFYLIFLTIFICFFLRDKKMFLVLSASFIYHFVIFYYVWFEGIKYQKACILFLPLIFCYMVCYENRTKILSCAVGILFSISLIFSVYNIVIEMKYNFSSAKEAAQFIRDNLNNEKIFYVEGYPFSYTPISAYMPDKEFYHVGMKQYITFQDFTLSLEKQTERPEADYLIQDHKAIQYGVPDNYELIFETDKRVISVPKQPEIYWIYKKI